MQATAPDGEGKETGGGGPSFWARARLVIAMTAIAAAGLGWFQLRSPFLQSADYAVSDFAVALFADQLEDSHPEISVALIREETLVDAPAYSPIDRRVLARTVEELDALGPAVIGLDIIFDKATDPEADQALLDAIRAARAPIVLGAYQDRSGELMIPEQSAFQEAYLAEAVAGAPERVTVGYLNATTEIDGVIRRLPTRYDAATEMPSFASLLAAAATGRDAPAQAEDAAGRIAWLRSPLSRSDIFSRLYIEEVLVETSASPEPPLPILVAAAVEDRIVIIGPALRSISDAHATPLNVGFSDEMLGVEIHAQLTAQLLDGRRYYEGGALISWAAMVAAFALAMALTFIASKRWLIDIGVVVVLYLAVFVALFASTRIFLPLVGPALAWALASISAKLILTVEESRSARAVRRRAAQEGGS